MPQRAVLHEDGSDRTASAIELGFEHYAAGGTRRVGAQFLQVGDQADHFHQQVEVGFLLGRDIDEHGGAAPVFRHQAAIGELLLHAIGHGFGLIDLVHRDDDRNFRRVRVIDSFERLRHHAVVGSHHQHDDVGGLGAAGTHAGERFVAGRIEEHDLAPVGGRFSVHDPNFVGADVLRDSAGFAFRDGSRANGVEQRSLAVIDVSHDGNHGRPRNRFRSAFLACTGGVGDLFLRLLFEADDVGVGSEEARHLAGEFGVERLVDGREHAARQQTRDQILRANIQLLRQILHADAFGDGDVPRDRLRLIRERKPRRRNVALHRAFLHPAWNIALSGTSRRTTGTAAGTRWSRRRHGRARADSERTRTGRRLARRMHRTAFTGPQAADGDLPELADADAEKSADRYRTSGHEGAMRSARRAVLASAAAPCRPAADRFAERSCAEAAARARTGLVGAGALGGVARGRRRRRSGLRHDFRLHACGRRRRRCWARRCRRRRSRVRRAVAGFAAGGAGGAAGATGTLATGRTTVCGVMKRGAGGGGGAGFAAEAVRPARGGAAALVSTGGAAGRTGGGAGGRRSLLLLGDQLQHIAGLGDVREVNLGLDFVSFAAGARLGGRGLGFSGTEVSPHLFGFVFFDRTGVRLLLRDTDFDQDIKNRLALDFQFPGQIVDSNLTHPPFLGPATAP